MRRISYARHRFPPVIIQHAVRLYLRFALSYRDVEDLLAVRGIDASHQTVCRWTLKFGADYAQRIRAGRIRQRQEREANAFAIEALTPRRLLGRHLKRSADLEHALAIAERFDVSRAAAVRRCVALHEEVLAVLLTRHGEVLYLDKSETFPRTSAWKGDAIGHLLLASGADRLSCMDEVRSEDWLAGRFRGGVFAQTLFQADGYAMTLMLAEPECGGR